MRGLQFSINDFKRHPWLHLLSICTISVSLIIVGLFFLIYQNVNLAAQSAEPKLTGTAFLSPQVELYEIADLRKRLLFLEGVITATHREKQSVLRDLGEFVGSANMESLGAHDLFPDVIEITVSRDISDQKLDELRDIIQSMAEVVEVDFSRDVVAQFAQVKHALTLVGTFLLIGLLVGSGFVIANFMGMRHQARRREIQIVSYVGASRSFVLIPFIWESLIEGFLGGLAAAIVIYATKTFVSISAPGWLESVGLEQWSFLSSIQLVGLFGLGIGMALVGSFTVFFRLQENG